MTNWTSLYVPLLVHPAPHFFVGLGPFVTHDVDHEYTAQNGGKGKNEGTTVGAALTVGGWF